MKIKNRIPMYIAVQLEGYGGKRVWLQLPANKERFDEAVGKIDGDCGCFRISDYAVKVPKLSIGDAMRTPLSVMNYLASRLNRLTDDGILKLCAIADSDYYFDRVGQILDFTFQSHYYRLLPGITDEELLGQYHIGGPKNYIADAVLKRFIDRRDYGRRLAETEKGAFTPHGYITSTIGWGLTPKMRNVPDSLNLKGYLDEDLYGDWSECDVTI